MHLRPRSFEARDPALLIREKKKGTNGDRSFDIC